MAFLDHLSAFGLLVYLSSVFMWVFTTWGIIHFWPGKVRTRQPYDGASWLLVAIWIGFFGNGLSVTVWQVLGDPMKFYGVITTEQYYLFGDIFGDLLGKGCASLSVYLHFYARWKSIPEDQQPYWRPLLMGYYPDKQNVLYRMYNKLLHHSAD